MKFRGYIVRYRYDGSDVWFYSLPKSGSLPQIYSEKGAKAAIAYLGRNTYRPIKCEMIAVVVNPYKVDVEIQHTDLTSQ